MASTGPTVDVVVPTHGGAETTASCLRCLRAQTLAHQVIVVDDASPDDTVARVRTEFPEVKVVALTENVGYARACNLGIRAGVGEIVVLLNNDVDAEPAMLERMVAPFQKEPRLGSVAPLLLRPDGSIDAVGICADATLAGFVRLPGAARERAGEQEPLLLGPYGAAGAYRRNALDEVGLFDEQIFMYGEELDLALRLRGAGWETVAAIAARGTHLGGATVGRGTQRQRRLSGFGRGYVLRAYGVIWSRLGPRALLVEVMACLGDLVFSRDLEGARGRWAGWRAGRQAGPRPATGLGIDVSIGLVTSIRLRASGR